MTNNEKEIKMEDFINMENIEINEDKTISLKFEDIKLKLKLLPKKFELYEDNLLLPESYFKILKQSDHPIYHMIDYILRNREKYYDMIDYKRAKDLLEQKKSRNGKST
jgi:hypothetical protein